MRGRLTDEIKGRTKALLGVEATTGLLRLLPHIQYTMMNSQKLDANKMNMSDREALRTLKEAGHISGGITGLAVTKEFWDAMNQILWLGYVDIGE